MKELKTIVYEKEDYEKLENMDAAEICNLLNEICDKWIPLSRYCGQDDYEGDYADFKGHTFHVALQKAIQLIRN